MPITFFCPVCNVKVDIPDRMGGKSAPCPSCGNVIDVPRQGRSPASLRLSRRIRVLLPWLFAGAALAGLAVALGALVELGSVRTSLEGDLKTLQGKLGELESRAAAAPAPAAPVRPAAPPERRSAEAGDHAALQREIASLRDADEELHRKLQDLEGEIARLRGVPAPAPVKPVEVADDEDIEIKIDAKQDALSGRPRFTFAGPATNSGTKLAPVVLISIRVIGFQGLNPMTRQPVATVSYAATLTERIRSLPPGTTANVVKDLFPTDPALLSREVLWEPQFEVSTRVLKE